MGRLDVRALPEGMPPLAAATLGGIGRDTLPRQLQWAFVDSELDSDGGAGQRWRHIVPRTIVGRGVNAICCACVCELGG